MEREKGKEEREVGREREKPVHAAERKKQSSGGKRKH